MLGDRIKELRIKHNNMTQAELAKAINVSQSTIAMLETNKREPSHELIIKLAQFFNCSTDFLLGQAEVIPINAIPIDSIINLPIIGTVKAGPDGLAYEDFQGYKPIDKKHINGGNYYYLKVKGESMLNDGIYPGDYVLVREQNDVENGERAIVIVNGEEGTLKKVYKQKNSIILQSSNPSYPPRIFEGKEKENVKIIGKVKALVRDF